MAPRDSGFQPFSPWVREPDGVQSTNLNRLRTGETARSAREMWTTRCAPVCPKDSRTVLSANGTPNFGITAAGIVGLPAAKSESRKSCGDEGFRVKCGVVRLIELLKRHEGKTLEFKRDLSSPEGILKTLVAFANTAGGTVVIGVEDGSKNVRGVPDVLASEEKLANLVSDSILPRLIPDTDVVPWRNLNVLAVQVYPSNTRPHYLERLGPDAGVFIRLGSTNRRAEALQIEELKRWNRMDSFDEQAVPDLKSEAIDFRAASEFFAPYRQLTSQAWGTLRITTEHQGRQVPTIGGLLLFGRDRFARFPDAWIQAGRFAGSNRARLLDSVEIRSFLPRAADEAIAFARKHLKIGRAHV